MPLFKSHPESTEITQGSARVQRRSHAWTLSTGPLIGNLCKINGAVSVNRGSVLWVSYYLGSLLEPRTFGNSHGAMEHSFNSWIPRESLYTGGTWEIPWTTRRVMGLSDIPVNALTTYSCGIISSVISPDKSSCQVSNVVPFGVVYNNI